MALGFSECTSRDCTQPAIASVSPSGLNATARTLPGTGESATGDAASGRSTNAVDRPSANAIVPSPATATLEIDCPSDCRSAPARVRVLQRQISPASVPATSAAPSGR